MQVAFITSNITNAAGTERILINVANYLTDKGYSLEIHSISSLSGAPYYPLNKKVIYKHYGLADYSENANWIQKLYLKVANTFKIKTVFKTINADVIIGVGKHINIYLTLFFKKKQHQTVIGSEHFPQNAPMSGLARLTRRLCYPRLEGLIINTEFDRIYYTPFVKNVVIIPNAYSFYPDEPASLQNKIVLAIGRHTEQKGFDMLINLWMKVADTHPDWTLKIVGKGPLLNFHKDLAEKLGIGKQIIFLPPSKDVISLYKEASIYVLPSRYEAFPMVLLEAMACGLPCVCFDCKTGPSDIINNGEDGIFVEPNNTILFYEALVELMDNSDKRALMAKAARQHIQQFSPERIGEKWINLIEAII